MVRLNRFIASATDYSRRQADAFIKRGQVKVNGKVVRDLSTQVDLTDRVELDGVVLKPQQLVYYLLNKPRGYVCTTKDKHADKIVTELVPDSPPVFPVGRLDKDTRGLLVLTNDGDLAYQLTHPKFNKEKEYYVTVNKEIRAGDLERLIKGIEFADGKVGKFDLIELLPSFNQLDRWQKIYTADMKRPIYRIVIHQGLNRQIRVMLSQLGYQVLDLLRVRIAQINLWDLPVGQYRKLRKSDIMKLIN